MKRRARHKRPPLCFDEVEPKRRVASNAFGVCSDLFRLTMATVPLHSVDSAASAERNARKARKREYLARRNAAAIRPPPVIPTVVATTGVLYIGSAPIRFVKGESLLLAATAVTITYVDKGDLTSGGEDLGHLVDEIVANENELVQNDNGTNRVGDNQVNTDNVVSHIGNTFSSFDDPDGDIIEELWD